MEITTGRQENRLMAATLFVFFGGASSMLLGNLIPFLREVYGFSYAHQGLLLSLPSWGNLVSIFLTGYMPCSRSISRTQMPKQRETFVNEWYRTLLKAEVEKYLPKWVKITGLQCCSCQSKYMTTKWGTCNTSTGKIWLNLQLAKKPLECLEYVILHELVRLRVRNHGPEFVAEMKRYMQNWLKIRNQLNESKLDNLEPME